MAYAFVKAFEQRVPSTSASVADICRVAKPLLEAVTNLGRALINWLAI